MPTTELVSQLTRDDYGMFHGTLFEDYEKIPAVNFSSLRNMMRSPLAYRWFKDHPSSPTAPMVLGNHTHRMILEPDTIGDFAVWGEKEGQNVRRGKTWEAFQAECAAARLQIITAQERKSMISIATAVRKSSLAMRFLAADRSEVAMVWKDKTFDRDIKGRADKIGRISGVAHLTDLKTCRDCRKFPFGNAAYRMGYHIQLAMYREGYRIITGEDAEVYEIAVENKPPYELAVYHAPNEVLDKGLEDYAFLMKQLVECERTDTWPPREEGIGELSLPSYAYGSDADEFSFADLTEDTDAETDEL
jgi:hypothetical protein